MKPALAAVAAVALALAVPRLLAQTRPDLSGTWSFNDELTRPSDRTRAHYNTLIIKQTAGEMSVEGVSFQQHLPPVVYKLDGSESTTINADGTTKAKATWQGGTLAIDSRRTFAGPQGDFVIDTKETWTLANGVLMIERTQTTGGGRPVTDRFAFTNGPLPAAANASARGRDEGTASGEVDGAFDGGRLLIQAVVGCPKDPVGFDKCITAKARTYNPSLRTSDGKPDLQGFWTAAGSLTGTTPGQAIEARPTTVLFNGGNSMVVDPEDGVLPYQHWAIEERERRQRPENALEDPQVHCYSAGLPRLMYIMPFQILRTKDHFVFLHEVTHSYRIIAMDGRPHLGKAFTAWQGDSVGRWEGQTLVIETTNNNGMTYLDLAHSFLSRHLKVTETFQMVDKNLLYWRSTQEDPQVFTRPWTMAAAMLRQIQKGFEIYESACHEENQDLEHIQAYIERAKGGQR